MLYSSEYSSETTSAEPPLTGVQVSVSLVASSFAAATAVAQQLTTLFDSSPSGAAGLLVIALKAQGLHNNPPFYVSSPAALVDPSSVILFQGTTAPPPPAPPAPMSPPPPVPPGSHPAPAPPLPPGAVQNITGSVSLVGIPPKAFGVIGTGNAAKVNTTAPLVRIFAAVLAAQLGAGSSGGVVVAVAVSDCNPVYGTPSSPPSGRRRLLASSPTVSTTPVVGSTLVFKASLDAALGAIAVQAQVVALFNPANGTFTPAFFTAARPTLALLNVTRQPNATAYTLLAAGVSLNVTAPPSAAAAASARAVAKATAQLDGLTSTASTVVVICVCALTGCLLAVAIAYTVREQRRRDAELRKLNSVGR